MYTSLQLLQAAKYYNAYQGVPVTMKSCTNLVNLLGDRVVEMAQERGFNHINK